MRNGRVDVLHAHDGNERHHLLFHHEGMILIRLAEQQIGIRRRVDAGRRGQHRDVLADEILLHVRAGAASPAAFESECRLREPVDGRRVKLKCPCALHGSDERIGDRGDDEDFLLADAEQVVVEGSALDDASRGAIEIGRLVDDDRRIARTAGDHALARLGRGLCHRRSASAAKQRNLGMMEDLIGGLEARLDHGGNHIRDAKLALEFAIPKLQRVLRHLGRPKGEVRTPPCCPRQ